MKYSYDVVRYTPEFRAQVLDLQKHHWGRDGERNSKYFEWKYEQNPYLERPWLHLGICAGKVVGMRGMFGARWELGRDSFSAWTWPAAADAVVAPEHRSRGLFGKIVMASVADAANHGERFVLSLSASRQAYLTSVKLGARSLGSLRTLEWRAPRTGTGGFGPFDACTPTRIEVSDGTYFSARPRIDEMADLVRRTAAEGRLRHVRDEQYFRWRFQNPLSKYRFLFQEKAELEGYLVLQKGIDQDEPSASIVDWEANEPSVEADLIELVTRYAHLEKVTLWSAGLSGRSRGAFQGKGFVERQHPQRSAALVTATDQESPRGCYVVGGRDLSIADNWSLRMIYSDGI